MHAASYLRAHLALVLAYCLRVLRVLRVERVAQAAGALHRPHLGDVDGLRHDYGPRCWGRR